MINVEYISSDGKKYSLQNDKRWITEGTFHRRSWKQNQKGFKRESVTYDLTLTIRGTLEERIDFLNEFRASIDNDVIKNKEGTISVNGAYIKGFFTESETGVSEIKKCWSEIKLKLYCKESAWITEKGYEFKKGIEKKSGDWLDFSIDFPFDLTGDEKGIGNVQIDHYTECDFLLTLYGPCTNPRIVIGDNLYEVKTKLDEGEYLTINSRAGTVVRVRTSGIEVNEFDNRTTVPNSPFEKIQPGYNLVSWDGSFGFDLLLYMERSEPAW
nr:MAG TPA: tail protein [Caudoviricetes sp.]